MKIANKIEKHNGRTMYRVISASVDKRLSGKEIYEVFTQLHEKMKTPDPENPNLWTVRIGDFKLWGILDPGAGPANEDVLTLLFPEDY